jgi:hypothetical protein
MTWLGAANVRLEMKPVEQPICHKTSRAKGLSTRNHCLERRRRGAIESGAAGPSSNAGAEISIERLLDSWGPESKCI